MDTDAAGLNGLAGDDLSALAWVQGELRRSLEMAHKALRRYLKEADGASGGDLDAVDPSLLRHARTHLHQGVGALELVGLPAVADVLRASERAVQRLISKPGLVDLAAIDVVERVSFALLDFLTRLLARKAVSPVMLFPQYRAALALAGADRVHPADLWKLDWQWLELPPDTSARPRDADDDARSDMETEVLALMREPGEAALRRMSGLCADLGAGARVHDRPQLGALWQLAAAVFEAQASGLLGTDVFSKRMASRLLAQLRSSVRGQAEPSDRLAQDLLFFCSHAQAPTAAQVAPRLEAVRSTWRLQDHPVVDYDTARLGRFDPAHLALARKRVAAAKDSWSAVAGGEKHRLAGMTEQFALVSESLQRLFPAGDVLAQSLQATVAQTVASGQAPSPQLAMEVATGILYVDASLEDGELDEPELGDRVQRLARRIDEVRQGAAPQPLDIWMEELYRRVADRQTMGSVVQELRSSLSEVEKQIDQYFRDPAARHLLIPVPAQLSSMRGVLSVLGMDQASQAALHMRDDVDALAQTEVDPQRAIQAGTFDRLADNLGALSFLIDMLSVQPQLAKSLFRFDPETGSLSAVMGQSERVSAFAQLDAPVPGVAGPTATEPLLLDQLRALGIAAASSQLDDLSLAREAERLAHKAMAADQPELASLLADAHAGLSDEAHAQARSAWRTELATSIAGLTAAKAEPPPAAAPVPAPQPTPPGGTGLEDDVEMRDIFIEEAREVVADANAAIERLVEAPDNQPDMTTVRRAFHTLKGSSRMVGLRDFGDAAWSCEQLFNARLAQAPHMDPALRLLTTEALVYLAAWTEAIAAGRNEGHHSAAVARAADALRLDGARVPIEWPRAQTPTPPVAAAPAAEATLALDTAPVLDEKTAIWPRLPIAEFEDQATAALDGGAPHEAPTIVMPVAPLSREPAAPVAAETELDFELSLPELDDDSPLPPPQVQSLMHRVPDLPSAADLDLERFETVSLPVRADELDFELDLGDFNEVPAAPAAPAAQPAASEAPDLLLELSRAEAEPLPTPEALEIDFEALAALEPSAAPVEAGHEPEPFIEPLVEPVVESESVAETTDLDLDLSPPDQPGPSEADLPLDFAPAVDEAEPDEQIKLIGPLRISIPLFNIYLNEADELSRRLVTELAEWALEHERHAVSDNAVALAHSLAGSSATVGYVDLSALARALEHALMRSHAAGHGRLGEPALFNEAAEEIRRLLHQFAAGFLRQVDPGLMEQLAAHERLPLEIADALPESDLLLDVESSELEDAAPSPLGGETFVADDDIDAVDALDAELFPIFEEEADELLPQLQSRLRDWHDHPGNPGAPAACMRTLHTFKGGARLAGAMRLGEMAHRLETAIEHLSGQDELQAVQVEPLLARGDAMAAAFEALRRRGPQALLPPPPTPATELTVVLQAVLEPLEAIDIEIGGETITADGPAVPAVAIDWSRFTREAELAEQPLPVADKAGPGAGAAVRVRAGLLDRMLNNAGEVSIARSRIDGSVRLLQGSLAELTDSMERMRRQLRDIEVQAETQISSRLEAAKAASQTFDPLEMDRFTRFQELTRFMAESVNDVATLQRSLQRTLQSAEDELAVQARLTRDLQDDLLRTRMVEFESLADRLHRTVRQAAKETGKQVRLEMVGGGIEIDRGVLERMAGAFEHLLRNCVAHGIEAAAERAAAGKDAGGLITVTVAQSGNEVAVEFADDGAGLDLARIRQRGLDRGLLAADAPSSEAELSQLIFASGFSTAESVTELAGRGIGLDVVRAEVNAVGGRVEVSSEAGLGTRFRLLLPLTTAVTQIVMLRCGQIQVAVPSPLIEIVRRVPTAEVEQGYIDGHLSYTGAQLPLFWLASLLQAGARGPCSGRNQSVVIIRSAAQRVAVHVDEVVGNQEVVVKNVGPQLARLPGLAGVTLLPSGTVALIYNPVALASVYAQTARELAATKPPAGAVPEAAPLDRTPMVMVVDDSLTVRRVTQRLLVREGYRVVTAKDGLDALERLAEERPMVLISDIEMPRMDGFDLVRNVRADPKLQGLPVIMITSRIAQKHRDYAAELGVDHYLGKPYSEEELLGLMARYMQARALH